MFMNATLAESVHLSGRGRRKKLGLLVGHVDSPDQASIARIQHNTVVPLCDTRDLGEIFFDDLHPHARGRRSIGRREPYIDHQILELDAVIEASTTKE